MDDKMRDDYNEYLTQHIGNVKVGFDWLCKNMPELFEGYDADYLGGIISNHDASKYDDEEYYAYCEYFYGEKTKEVTDEFDVAWLHHQHCNPHHWQHWLLREDDGDMKALEMPYEYIIEMIMDWWSFSWKSNNLYEIFNWYENNKSRIVLHPQTTDTVEHILELMKNRIDSVH